MSISAPISPARMPVQKTAENADHQYRTLGWFTRAINKVFGGFRKKDCEIYKKQQELKKQLDDAGRRRAENGGFEKELKELSKAEKKAQGSRDKAALMDKIKFMKIELGHKTVGQQVYWDMTVPKPVYHPEYESKNGGSGFYTKAEFDTLKPIDKKIGDYSIGGKPLSEKEYCGLVAACSPDPKNALPGFTKSGEYDPTAVESIKNMGYDEQRAKEIVTASYTTMITTDLMKGNLRGSQGNVLDVTVYPARMDTFDILDKYKKGDKAPLAQAIARGITIVASDTGNRQSEIGCNTYNHAEFADATADLLERDPELKKLAFDSGLEQGDLEAVRGMANMSRADMARRNAQIGLAEAAYNGTVLSEEQKRQYAVDILTANLMESKVFAENYLEKKNINPHRAETERLQKESAKKNLILTMDEVKHYAKHPEERPLPPKGSLYFDQINTFMGGRTGEFNVHPDTMLEVSDAEVVEGIRNIANRIVEKNGLAELSTKELSNALVMGNGFNGTALIEKGKQAIQSGMKHGDPNASMQKNLEEEELYPLNT